MGHQRLFIMIRSVMLASFLFTLSPVAYQTAQTPDLGSLSDTELREVVIRLKRTGCYGNCPAYSLRIRGDGSVEYAGDKNVKVTGTRVGRVDQGAVRVLLTKFVQANYESIVVEQYSQQKCECGQCTDMPSAETEIAVRGGSHRVDHYYGCRCAPKALYELESAIDKTAHVERWTGDVSKQGPYGTTCFD